MQCFFYVDNREINMIVLKSSGGRKINVRLCLLPACSVGRWVGTRPAAQLSASQCPCQTSANSSIAINTNLKLLCWLVFVLHCYRSIGAFSKPLPSPQSSATVFQTLMLIHLLFFALNMLALPMMFLLLLMLMLMLPHPMLPCQSRPLACQTSSYSQVRPKHISEAFFFL